jgi:PAS domain S-box-containing protein
MPKRSDYLARRQELQESIIGLGERSLRKSYYPELQRHIQELEQANIDLRNEMAAHAKAREELQVSQHRLRLFLDASPDMYFLKDPGLTYLLVNEAQERFMGLAQEAILGWTDSDLLPKSLAGQCEAADRQAMEQRRQITVTLEHADRTYQALRQPVIINGELAGVAGITRDITESEQAEAERRKLQGQLAQAQKMESIGRLAGGVAHDFNNMLAVILGHTELALKQLAPGQPLYPRLRHIHEAAERSAELTRQLLAFARKQTVDPRVLDLNETIAGLIAMVRRLIGEDIDLAWRPGRSPGAVKIDPSQVDQLLMNLCVNARDAIVDTGKITIETGAKAFDEQYCAEHAGFIPGEYALLAVSDNGCGMDAEVIAHLFEPFFTTKATGQGTGLGLATVYGIVKQNNGFISVYSEPGQGTTFKVYLPRHEFSPAAARKDEPVLQALAGQGTILLVEDEPMLLEMATTMLELLGFTVLSAPSPDEAMERIKQHGGGVDLLVTDVVMPGMNGRELARHLQTLHPNLQCLYMSGYTANVIAHHGVLDQGVHFIPKPFTVRDLARKIGEIFPEGKQPSREQKTG